MSMSLRFLWYLHKLRKTQWWARTEIEKLQEKKLKTILKHAYENVEFYHRRFRSEGIKPEDIKTVRDLKKLPRTTRFDLQRNFPTLVSRGVSIDKCRKYTSSGSTGTPVTVLSHGKTESYRAALFMRPFFENGLKMKDKMVRISASPPNEKKWYEKLGLMRKVCLHPNEPIKPAVKLLAKYKPEAVYGHSSYIYLLAKEIAETKNDRINPRLIFTTAELLTFTSRSFIESVFGLKIFDFYGCVEVERVAWECKKHVGYHMDIDSQVIEIVNDHDEQISPGERGEIILTCLYNYTMPLIRYEVGDTGVSIDDECPCGRGLPVMKSIEGRADKFIELPSGRLVPPTSFLDIDEVPGIGQFQVIQQKKDRIVVKLVAGIGFLKTTPLQVQGLVERIVGDEVHVDIKLVDRIPREKSGKIIVVKSFAS